MSNGKQKVFKMALENLSAADLIDMIMKYPVVTRTLLLIRLKGIPNDPYVKFASEAAGRIKNKASAQGWKVIDLAGNKATKTKVLNAIKKENPDFVVYYGHASSSHIAGQANNRTHTAILTDKTVSVLSGRTFSTVSCNTAKVFGPAAIKAKTVAFLGYKDYHTIVTYPDALEDFIESSNAANEALLNGKTYDEACQIGWDAYDDKWVKWTKACQGKQTKLGKKVCPMIPPAFLKNRDGLARLGNPQAVARPIGILVNS